MHAIRPFDHPFAVVSRVAIAATFVFLSACGSGDAPPPPEVAPVPTNPTGPAPVPPAITRQPASVTTMPGQSATFSVVATGTDPLAYQWQRNGVAITGATSPSYVLSSTVLADSGSTFRVVVSNVAGTATSDDATLTVSPASPVLSISPQPADVTVVAGAMATFIVGGTCSSGTLTIQWQRNGADGFVDIPGATATTYTLMAGASDNGAQFRAVLSCSGAVATPSSVATLTVTSPAAVALAYVPVVGLRDQVLLGRLTGIDPSPGGGWDFTNNYTIRHLAADLSSVTLVAGGVDSGSADGPAATARFASPSGLVHDTAGNMYVADTNNHTIRRIATDGTVTTIAGAAGTPGLVDGTGAAARFSSPWGITLGPDGDLYVADAGNAVIRRVTTGGVVTTYAGSGTAGFADGAPALAQFRLPEGVVAAANGDLYVADTENNRIRRIVRSGTTASAVTTLAGTGSPALPGADGPGATAGIYEPVAIALGGTTLYVLDGNGTIRTIDAGTTIVSTFAGWRAQGAGYADGPLGTAQFNPASGGAITIRSGGGLIVTEQNGVRTVDASGTVTTIAAGFVDAFATASGTGVLAQLPFQLSDDGTDTSIVTDPSGRIVVAENLTRLVRRVDAAGNVTPVAGLAFSSQDRDGVGSTAQLVTPGVSITAAADGTLYVVDGVGISRIAPDGTTVFFAGSHNTGAMDGPPGVAAFRAITSLTVAPSGDVFAADSANFAIRRVDSGGNVTTYGGVLGVQGTADGPVATARFNAPKQVAAAPDGSLYVVDLAAGYPGGSKIRRIATDGSVSTVPGSAGTSAIAVDAAGTLYAAMPLSGGGAQLGVLDPASGAYTPIVATGSAIVVGTASPSLGPTIGPFTTHGAKQLVVVTGGRLVLVTVP